MSKQQQPNVVYVKEQNRGCLTMLVTYLLFGWIGIAVMALWKMTKWVWRWCVVFPAIWTWKIGLAYPIIWTWKGCMALWRVSLRVVQQLHSGSNEQ